MMQVIELELDDGTVETECIVCCDCRWWCDKCLDNGIGICDVFRSSGGSKRVTDFDTVACEYFAEIKQE